MSADSRFTFWGSYLDAANQMDPEDRASFINAIVTYGIEGTVPDMTRTAHMAFTLVRPGMDSSAKRSKTNASNAKRPQDNVSSDRSTSCEAIAEQVVERPQDNVSSDRNEPLIEEEVEVEVEDKEDRESEGGSKGGAAPHTPPRKRRFTPPSLEEVETFGRDYCETSGYPPGLFDANRFIDHFASNGWKVSGRAPMRDWRAAARNWIRNDAERSGLAKRKERVPDAFDAYN